MAASIMKGVSQRNELCAVSREILNYYLHHGYRLLIFVVLVVVITGVVLFFNLICFVLSVCIALLESLSVAASRMFVHFVQVLRKLLYIKLRFSSFVPISLLRLFRLYPSILLVHLLWFILQLILRLKTLLLVNQLLLLLLQMLVFSTYSYIFMIFFFFFSCYYYYYYSLRVFHIRLL